MKRAELLLSLSALSLASGYLLNNPAVSFIGVSILAHYSIAKVSFRPNILVKRYSTEVSTVGQRVELKVVVKNLSKLRGTVYITESSPDVEAEKVEINIDGQGEVEVTQTVIPKRRGRIKLEGKAVFEDELGLFSREFQIEDKGELIVLPKPREIVSGLKQGKPTFIEETSKGLGAGMETLDFEELREFLPGDDVRKIDWKATSRLHKPIVRVYRREAFSEVYVLINVDRTFRRGLTGKKIDYLTVLLSQLLDYLLKGNYMVRVISYDRKNVKNFVSFVKSVGGALRELELREEPGIPPVSPLPLVSPGGWRKSSGLLKAINLVKGSPYVIIIDDIGLEPLSIVEAARLLKRKGAKGLVISPNPIYFMRRENVNEENVLTLYRAYIERKKLLRKVSSVIPVVEIGPKDLLRKVVERL